MKTEQEARVEWIKKTLECDSIKEADAYLQGVTDFQTSLIEVFKKERENVYKKDYSDSYASGKISAFDEAIELVKTITPKK